MEGGALRLIFYGADFVWSILLVTLVCLLALHGRRSRLPVGGRPLVFFVTVLTPAQVEKLRELDEKHE